MTTEYKPRNAGVYYRDEIEAMMQYDRLEAFSLRLCYISIGMLIGLVTILARL